MRAAVVGLPTAPMVERLIGVVGLADTLQRQLGRRLSADEAGQRRRAQWTVTDLVSWFWCGQRLIDDPGYDWSGWVAQQWDRLTEPLPPAVPVPIPESALAQAA